MLTEQLTRALTGHEGEIVVLDIDGGQWPAGPVFDLIGSSPADTIIECGNETVTVGQLLTRLAGQDPKGTAQLYLREGGLGAWYDIGSVRHGRRRLRIMAGGIRCTASS